jgi:sugar phosphate isomerase/epimerase
MNKKFDSLVSRRQFFQTGAVTVAGLATAPNLLLSADEKPLSESGRPFKLSCAAYSYRKELTSGKMTLDDFINLCADLQLEAVELTSYYFPEKITPDFLNHLKRQTFLKGLDISGTAIRNEFCLPPGPERDKNIDHVKLWINYAQAFSAPCIRIFAGNPASGVSEADAIEWCADAIKISLEYAAKQGVFLALENHGGITARAATLKKICDKIGKHPWFGVNLDTGNFKTDAYNELQMIAPLAVNVQVKDYVYTPDGKEKTAPDLKKLIDILRGADYRGYVVLEYEGEEEAMTAVPKWIEKLRSAIHEK